MTKVRFVGDPNRVGAAAHDPSFLTFDGVDFPLGEDVDLDEKDHARLIGKLNGNSHFEVGAKIGQRDRMSKGRGTKTDRIRREAQVQPDPPPERPALDGDPYPVDARPAPPPRPAEPSPVEEEAPAETSRRKK